MAINVRRQFLIGTMVAGLLAASGGLSCTFGAAPASGATGSTPIVVGGDGDASLNAGAARKSPTECKIIP